MKKSFTAKTANKFELYEMSVQDTQADIAFIHRVYKKQHAGALPVSLREDFCGTAKLCADWVNTSQERYAVGVDLHAPTQKWGQRTHMAPLKPERAKRITLLTQNVLDATRKVDVTVAFNFSWCVFKTRDLLLSYFKRVRADLNKGGMFFLDIHGGSESFMELEETQKKEGFTYVWDQQPYDAINGHAIRHIHFRFKDGSEMRKAFTYDWRIWTLPEVKDLLREAGFAHVDVYWEGDDGKGNGNGKFKKVQRADNEAAWIAYVVAY